MVIISGRIVCRDRKIQEIVRINNEQQFISFHFFQPSHFKSDVATNTEGNFVVKVGDRTNIEKHKYESKNDNGIHLAKLFAE